MCVYRVNINPEQKMRAFFFYIGLFLEYISILGFLINTIGYCLVVDYLLLEVEGI